MARCRRLPLARAALLLVVSSVLAGCGSVAGSSAAPTTLAAPSATRHGSGPVDVLYAGSLLDTMTELVGPGFQSASGYRFNGVSGDSGSLASEIKGRTQVGDVFISANPSKDQALEGAAGGRWVTWYATFATSPLVLGYNPESRFGAQIRSGRWYKAVASPGFLLGRTDPATDPKGVLTVTALDQAARAEDVPALAAAATSSADVFPENTLVGRLQAGQLDAGIFYAVEAAAAGIPTVPLTGVPAVLHADYTVTVLERAPHRAAAAAFVSYLLGPAGTAALAREGLTVSRPLTVSGTAPSSLQVALSGR